MIKGGSVSSVRPPLPPLLPLLGAHLGKGRGQVRDAGGGRGVQVKGGSIRS